MYGRSHHRLVSGNRNGSGLTRCGASVVSDSSLFVQRFADQPQLQLFEVAQPAVEHLRAAARRAGREVAGLDKRDLQPARRRVKGGAGADHAAADDDDVELLAAEPLPGLFALFRAQQRLAVDRDRVAHFEWILVTRRYGCPFTGYFVARQSKSSCAINLRAASVIEPDSDG